MATSPITFQIGNGVRALRRLIPQAQRIPPPTQGKTPGARQAEFVICDQAIELFFRWVKQTLKIRHFVGTSENAVRLQIAVALIAFVLLRLAQATQDTQDTIRSPLAFARIVRANLMLRRRIDQLIPSPTRPKQRRPVGLQEAPA